jgi:hypothetical protein
MPRIALGGVIAAAVLIAAVLVVALQTGPSPQPAGQVVVTGQVTGTGGRPASGIKVWLNAWPTSAAVTSLGAGGQPVPVTVLGSAVTSATGAYAIRLRSPAALAPGSAANGVVRFQLMTGDRAGWDTFSFAAHLLPTMTGLMLELPGGRPGVANLNLMRHTTPAVPGR